MRSSLKLINVLVAAVLFVTPVAIASAQSGNDGFDPYYSPATGNVAEPIVVPSGDATASSPDVLPLTGADTNSALPDMGVYDFAVPADLSFDPGEPTALPVTGLDLSAVPAVVAYELAASGIDLGGLAAPAILPQTGMDFGAYDLAVPTGLSMSFHLGEPTALPVTGLDLSAVPDIVAYELAASGIDLGTLAAPAILPQTGMDISALPDEVMSELAASGVPLASDAVPVDLPVTGADSGALPFWVESELGIGMGALIGSSGSAEVAAPLALPVTGYMWSDDSAYAYGGASAASAALSVSGYIWSDDIPYAYGYFQAPDVVPYGYGDPTGAVTALPGIGDTGFTWLDGIPYVYGDTQALNDSSVAGMANAPASLPVTGGDRLGVVGGR